MKLVHKYGLFVACMLTFVIVSGCEDDPAEPDTKAGTFVGEEVSIGDGFAKSWVTLDEDGNPTAVGVTFSESALTYLEGQTEPETYTMMMPEKASATPYNHMTFDWNPGGHPPPGIYDLPHVDLHFYMISQTDRDAIKVVGEDTVKLFTHPEADAVPPDYRADPVGVPRMGIHWTDSTSNEWTGGTFDKTFIYGSFDGKMIFMEPMITKAYLDGQSEGTFDIKQPTVYPEAGKYYPMTYSVNFDAATQEYTVSMEGMVMR